MVRVGQSHAVFMGKITHSYAEVSTSFFLFGGAELGRVEGGNTKSLRF